MLHTHIRFRNTLQKYALCVCCGDVYIRNACTHTHTHTHKGIALDDLCRLGRAREGKQLEALRRAFLFHNKVKTVRYKQLL